MLRQEVYRQVIAIISNPEVWVPLLLVFALWTLMCICSYRLLRARPDIPHQYELLWGARWGPALLFGLLLFAYAFIYYGFTRTSYPFSIMILGNLILNYGFLLLPSWVQNRINGAFFSLVWLSARWKHKELDVDAWIARITQPSRRFRFWHNLMYLGIFIFNGYLLLGFTYPLDRSFARFDAETAISDSISQLLRQELPSPPVSKVSAYPMDDALDYLDDIGTVTRVTTSLRTLTYTNPDPAPPSPETGRYLLSVYVVPGTTKTEMQHLLRQVQDLLAARRVTSTWRIGVAIANSKQRIVGYYPPDAPHVQAVPSQ